MVLLSSPLRRGRLGLHILQVYTTFNIRLIEAFSKQRLVGRHCWHWVRHYMKVLHQCGTVQFPSLQAIYKAMRIQMPGIVTAGKNLSSDSLLRRSRYCISPYDIVSFFYAPGKFEMLPQVVGNEEWTMQLGDHLMNHLPTYSNDHDLKVSPIKTKLMELSANAFLFHRKCASNYWVWCCKNSLRRITYTPSWSRCLTICSTLTSSNGW